VSAPNLLDRLPHGWKAIVVSQIARTLIVGVAGTFSILAVRRAPASAFLDIAELLFQVSLSGYWLYAFSVDGLENMRSTEMHAVEAALTSAVPSDVLHASLLSAVATVILAIASLIGAHIEMMDSGHPVVAMLTVLAGVIDAKIVTDKIARIDPLTR
jgi:hypothetical protein